MEIYTEAQVREVLAGIGLKPEGETYNDFLCLCPFHPNTHSPAMSVSKHHGAYVCFSPECGEAGTLLNLVKVVGKRNEFEARRFIMARASSVAGSVEKQLTKSEEMEWEEFPADVLTRLHDQLWQHPVALDYLHGRGFKDETLKFFDVGYSAKRGMVTVPVHNPDGLPIGMVGRSIQDKIFKNSGNLQKNHTIFNVHNARRHGGTLIVCESSFDTMRIHQAGYPMAGALLGGNFSEFQANIISRWFDKIIIFTDNDPLRVRERCRKCRPASCKGHSAGRLLGKKITEMLPTKTCLWANFDVMPGAKDASDMTDELIVQAIENAQTNFEYVTLNQSVLY